MQGKTLMIKLAVAAILTTHIAVATSAAEPVSPQQTKLARIEAAREEALDYLWENRESFGMNDPGQELKEEGAFAGHGVVHFHFRQLQDKIPIHHAQLIVSVYPGSVSAENRLVGKLAVQLEPTISAHEATTIARKQAKAVGPIEDPSSSLILIPKNSITESFPDTDRLAWNLSVYASNDEEDVARTIFVDAHSGEILMDRDERKHARPQDKIAVVLFRGPFSQWFAPITAGVDRRSGNVNELNLEDPCYGSGPASSTRRARTTSENPWTSVERPV